VASGAIGIVTLKNRTTPWPRPALVQPRVRRDLIGTCCLSGCFDRVFGAFKRSINQRPALPRGAFAR
jgi:hypothetical protein